MHSHAIQPFSQMHHRVAALNGVDMPLTRYGVQYGALGAGQVNKWTRKCTEAKAELQKHQAAGRKNGKWKRAQRVAKWEARAANYCKAAEEAKQMLAAGQSEAQVDAALEAKYETGPDVMTIALIAGAGVLVLGGAALFLKRKKRR